MSLSTIEKQAAPSLMRDRRFLLLWLAQIVSSLGDWALLIAIPVTVYNGTNSRVALSFSLVAETLPVLLFGLIAGVFVDRWNRRNLMVVSDLGRAAIVLLLLNLHHLPCLSRQDLWLIYGVAFLSASFACVFNPARAAMVAALLPSEQLLQANALSSSSLRITQLIGPALAGVLLVWLHPRGVFLFDSLTFLAAAIFASLVADTVIAQEAPKGIAGIWKDLKEGLRCFKNSPLLGTLLALLSVASFAGGIYNAQIYAFTKDCLNAAADFGYLMAALGFGALLAVPLVAGPFKNAPPPRLIATGFGVMAAAGLALAYAPNLLIGSVALFLLGLGNMLVYLPVTAMFQMASEPNMRGRVYAIAGTLNASLVAISALAAAGLVSIFPHLRPIFACLAGVYFCCGLLTALLLVKNSTDAAPPAFVAPVET